MPQKHQIKMPSDERDKQLLVTRGIIDYGSAFVNRVELAKHTAFVHGQTNNRKQQQQKQTHLFCKTFLGESCCPLGVQNQL